MCMSEKEARRCSEVVELFRSFIEEQGDCCVVSDIKFGYILLTYFRLGRFEDNEVCSSAEELYHALYNLWYFHWMYCKAVENGVQEYEDYERFLTKEQKMERRQKKAVYEKMFHEIMETD